MAARRLLRERLDARRRRREYRRVVRRLAGPKLLQALAREHPHAFFVELGSNDGEKLDHLHETILNSEWRGLMVEPVPYVFERLRRNYGRLGRVALENAAIADRDGTMPFYHLAPVADPTQEGLPEWYDAIGSFSRELVLSHRACAADDRYAPHAAAMLRSALTATEREVAVHFLHGDRLSPPARDRLARMVERAGAEISFLEVPASEVAGLPTRRLADPSTWYRILLPELLRDLDRVLHLDSDVIVRESLGPLWETELPTPTSPR